MEVREGNLISLLHMFLKQMIEDFTYEDLEYYFENSKYFSYIRKGYMLTDEDKKNFELLMSLDAEFRKYSLDSLTVEKRGLYPYVRLLSHEDEIIALNDRGFGFTDVLGLPVDMHWSEDPNRAISLIIVLLLNETFYKQLESRETSSSSKEVDGLVTIEGLVVDDLDVLEVRRKKEMKLRDLDAEAEE